jgi:predicted ester cyclase
MLNETSKNKILMRRVYEELWNQGKPALAIELFEQPAGVERFVSEFLLAFPNLQHTVEGMVEEGELIAVKFIAHGTHTGSWQGLSPTGKAIHYSGMTWARIVNGKIGEHHTEWDNAGLIEQIRA